MHTVCRSRVREREVRISSLLKKDFSYSKYLRTVERKQKGKQQIVGAEFFVARCIFIGEKNQARHIFKLHIQVTAALTILYVIQF